MVGKNNYKLRREKAGNKYYRYAIKRLSVGVASVAVGAGILFAGQEAVQAETPEVTGDQQTEESAVVDQGEGQPAQVNDPTLGTAVENLEDLAEETLGQEANQDQPQEDLNEATNQEQAQENLSETTDQGQAHDNLTEEPVETPQADQAQTSPQTEDIQEQTDIVEETQVEEGISIEDQEAEDREAPLSEDRDIVSVEDDEQETTDQPVADEVQEASDEAPEVSGSEEHLEENGENQEEPAQDLFVTEPASGNALEAEVVDQETDHASQLAQAVEVFNTEWDLVPNPRHAIANADELERNYEAQFSWIQKPTYGNDTSVVGVTYPNRENEAVLVPTNVTKTLETQTLSSTPALRATPAENTEGRLVNSLVNFSNFEFSEIGSGDVRPNNNGKIDFTGYELLEIRAQYTLDDSITAGDYFTVEYGDYVLPGGLEEDTRNARGLNLRAKDGQTIARQTYDPETNTSTYTFTDYVDVYENIRGSLAFPHVPNRRTVTDDLQTVPVSVSYAGELAEADITFDYGNKGAYRLLQGFAYSRNLEEGTYRQTIYLNQPGYNIKPTEAFGEMTSELRLIGEGYDIENITVYQVLDDSEFVDSFKPNYDS